MNSHIATCSPPAVPALQFKSNLSQIKHRPDIDGLRAVAVMAVVLFHAFPSWITGGFIGVDVFFVISGYLISKILFENLQSGSFDFLEFYTRRINRILPALILVIASTTILGWLILMPEEYKQLGSHVTSGAGFFSNFTLLREMGYFDNSADSKPLLHLWSLSIEEQFYIAWPLATWLAWRYKLNITATIIGLLLASFTLNVASTHADSISSFYLPQTRFWELLCGSLLAWVDTQKRWFYSKRTSAHQAWFPNLISCMGALLLVCGFSIIDRDSIFPGVWAVVPVLGALLLIAAGEQAWINKVILSNRGLVFFGLISFPLYLWHWPLLSIYRITQGADSSHMARASIVAVSVGLSWLTYRYIERNIRPHPKKHRIALALLVLLLVSGIFGRVIQDNEGFNFREVALLNEDLDSGFDGGLKGVHLKTCNHGDTAIKNKFSACVRDDRGPVKYALLGDSKAQALYAGLARTSYDGGRWMFIGGNGPNGAPIPLISSDVDLRPFQPLIQEAIEIINKNKQIEKVLIATSIRNLFQISDRVEIGNISSYNPKYLSELSRTKHYKRTFNGLSEAVSKIAHTGKKIILITDNPALPEPQDCLPRKTAMPGMDQFLISTKKDCTVVLDEFQQNTAIYKQLLHDIQAKYPKSVEVFDATNIYCDMLSNACPPIKNGRLLYAYTDHISDYTAGLIGLQLNDYMNNRRPSNI